NFEDAILVSGGDDDLGKDAIDHDSRLQIETAIYHHDAAKGCHGVCSKGAFVSFGKSIATAYSARIAMLEDDHCRLFKEADSLERGIDIHDVVERKFFAV